MNNVFTNGAVWLRADFHLHTKADSEFEYEGEESYFTSNYIDALKNADIRVGAITNHNKFKKEEFVALRNYAKKQDIFLLPGVELSVNEGANGVHTIIVFSDEWLKYEEDYINPFLTSIFTGKTPQEYENRNGRTDKNLLQVVEALNQCEKDYFLLFAHVEEAKGLWNECKGGKLSDWREDRYKVLRERTLGFQKVRTNDLREQVKQWFGDWYPCEVEGSDPKCIDEIGRGKEKCFLKIGEFSFEAVKFALQYKERRVSKTIPKLEHSHIKSIKFEGGIFDGKDEKKICFSPSLNTLIGIRGSGKSAIIEALRYALDIPFGEKAGDIAYKQKLVEFALGSGGKVIVTAVNNYGMEYEISRIFNEAANVYSGGELKPGISICETIIHKPVYFGQKDLSNTGEGFEKDLVEKLTGGVGKLVEIRRAIQNQKTVVTDLVASLQKTSNIEEIIEEYEKEKNDTEHKLSFYKNNKIEEKLEKQLTFDEDSHSIDKTIKTVRSFLSDMGELLEKYQEEFSNFSNYSSKYNEKFFEDFHLCYSRVTKNFSDIKQKFSEIEFNKKELEAHKEEFNKIKENLADEFAQMQRDLSSELVQVGNIRLNLDEFRGLKTKQAQLLQFLEAAKKQIDNKDSVVEVILKATDKLNQLWREEFLVIKGELDKIQTNSSSLVIEAVFKGDKKSFVGFMESLCKGIRFSKASYETLSQKYQDFLSVYSDIDNAAGYFGKMSQNFTKTFLENLHSFLTFQVPNKFLIKYRGRELQEHSLGQRASALILFVLSMRENDLIIIDQPEDDLDNQTIYEDVIKFILELKPSVQFIFVTHNPNIPVLGDAEQIHSCAFGGKNIEIESGSIDDKKQQKNIVNTMEGGREAFKLRKGIYASWKF